MGILPLDPPPPQLPLGCLNFFFFRNEKSCKFQFTFCFLWQTVKGLKGPSPFLHLYDFDVAGDVVVDYMHCVLEGVVKVGRCNSESLLNMRVTYRKSRIITEMFCFCIISLIWPISAVYKI